ncbi:MAG TPA: hypothetical protein PKN87_10930 [Syntrophomonadaceae bacterium]|nr:hypothetical protein [Syntrophomonadaceae bacterium]HPR94386.1 hypothetical protein [Syntrophomonadaceae bacterium]
MKKRWTIAAVLTLSLLLLGGMALSASAAASSNTAASPAGLLRQGIMAGQQRAQTALHVVADLTGLSIEDIRTERVEGKSLAAIAEAEGISEQTVIDKVIAERTAVLEQLKADDKITDAQYENCISNMQERIKANIERTTVGPANGNKTGGRGGCMQGNGQGLGQGSGMGRGMGQNQANCPYNTSI